MAKFDPLAYLRWLYNTPSDFRDDWRAYALNVVGHSAVVGGLAALFPFWLAGAAYGAFEGAQWAFRGAKRADSVEDWAFVMLGALAWHSGDWKAATIFAAFLLAETLWRKDNPPN